MRSKYDEKNGFRQKTGKLSSLPRTEAYYKPCYTIMVAFFCGNSNEQKLQTVFTIKLHHEYLTWPYIQLHSRQLLAQS